MIQDVRLWWAESEGESTEGRIGRMNMATIAARQIARLSVDHRVCVQAGGHVGLWPRALASHFGVVYTFEPDAENWACLVRNATRDNIIAARGALGNRSQGIRLERTTPKSGLWRTVAGGQVPTYRVDDLGLEALDALVLDIEGDELKALQGAERSLIQFRPLVWFEARINAVATITWLRDRGYGVPHQALGRDLVMQAAA